MDFKHILSNRWFLVGGGLVLLLVIVSHLKGSNAAVGNGVTTSTTNQPSDAVVQANLAAQVSLAQAQIGAATAANATSAQVAMQTQQIQGELAAKGIDANVAKYSIDANLQGQTLQIQAAALAQERDDNLQASIAKWTLDNAQAMQAQNLNFQLAYATQANSTTIATSQIIAGVNLASIQAQRDTTVAALQASAAETASVIGGQVAMNDSNNAVKINDSNNAARTAQKQSSNNLIGGIVGGVLGIFSDRRLKRDVVYLGTDRNGLPRYSYRYHDDPSYQTGVMADDVRRIRPDAMGPRMWGYDTVRYAAAA